MPCERWKDEWVARLYDELEPEEQRRLTEHLERCGACRKTLDELAVSRSWLAECAPPVPAAPRVLILRPARPWWSAWAFAVGASAALVVFGLVGGILIGTGTDFKSVPGIVGGDLSARMETLEARLVELERQPPDGSQQAQLTRDELRSELQRVERRIDRERVRDLEYLLQSLTATEMRTGTWMNQTQEAIQLLSLRQDPRFSEK